MKQTLQLKRKLHFSIKISNIAIAKEKLDQGTLTSKSLEELIVERADEIPSSEFAIYEEGKISNCFKRKPVEIDDDKGGTKTVMILKSVDCNELKE